MFTYVTSIIIPTRNRPEYLIKLIKFLRNKLIFNQIIVVDSSDAVYRKKINNICSLYKLELYRTYPSSAHQRNLGIKKVKKNSKYIFFIDDDVTFYKNSFIEMNKSIKKYFYSNNICGFAFNLLVSNQSFFNKFKKLKIFRYLNLYSNIPGKVLLNGWHMKIESLKEDFFVEWLFTGATIYKKDSIINKRFDVSFGSYSYLEDLDFSYSLFKKHKKLLLVSKAKFFTFNTINRNNFNFGIIEIINRYKFVKKNQLNTNLFYFTAFLRASLSFLGIIKFDFKLLNRAFGNIFAISKIIFFKKI
jgi:GT2 family glycosyltransferase